MATTYYSETSGIGRLLRAYHPDHGRRVGAVGLGAGTLAAWGDAGDTFRFYEINDDVARLATKTFTYLKDSKAKTELVMGDARLKMEGEKDQNYDVIILDAFSSDAIPVHLLTLEAFQIYNRHLRSDGVIAVHVSNRYLDLRPIVARAAQASKYNSAIINDSEPAADDDGIYASDWILLTRNKTLLSHPLISKVAGDPIEVSERIGAWTDDRSDLLRILITKEHSFLEWLQSR